jgi:hypothetical protein
MQITFNDSPTDAILKVSKNNPGAGVAISQMMETVSKVDPDSTLGAIGVVFKLDDLEVYGEDVHMLYKYHCGQDPKRLLLLMRAVYLGLFSLEKFKAMSKHPRRDLLTAAQWDRLIMRVKKEVPRFKIDIEE